MANERTDSTTSTKNKHTDGWTLPVYMDPGLSGAVDVALAAWGDLRKRLPRELRARTPSRLPDNRYSARAIMREALWLRRRPELWFPEVSLDPSDAFDGYPATRDESLPMAPVESGLEDVGTICLRAAPELRRDTRHPLGCRLAPDVRTASYAPAEGSADSPIAAAMADVDSGTVDTLRSIGEPAGREKKATEPRKGVARVAFENGTVIELRTYEPPKHSHAWIDYLLERVTRAKRLTEAHRAQRSGSARWTQPGHEVDTKDAAPDDLKAWAFDGEHPLREVPPVPSTPGAVFVGRAYDFLHGDGGLYGRAHPTHVLEDARELCRYRGAELPDWIDLDVVKFLIAQTSFESGSYFQTSEAELGRKLGAVRKFAEYVRDVADRLVIDHYGKLNEDPPRATVVRLARLLQLADRVQGCDRNDHDRFHRRLEQLKSKYGESYRGVAFYRLLSRHGAEHFKDPPDAATAASRAAHWYWDPTDPAPAGTLLNATRTGWFIIDKRPEARNHVHRSAFGEETVSTYARVCPRCLADVPAGAVMWVEPDGRRRCGACDELSNFFRAVLMPVRKKSPDRGRAYTGEGDGRSAQPSLAGGQHAP